MEEAKPPQLMTMQTTVTNICALNGAPSPTASIRF